MKVSEFKYLFFLCVIFMNTDMQYNNTFYRPMGIKENWNKNTITNGRDI